MNSAPLVSVLIPVYNRESYIQKAVQSALQQSYSNVEVVVIDNCSTDRTWEVLKDLSKLDSRVQIYRNEENLGPWENWKKGLLKCTGEYLKIIWSDDWIDKSFLAQCVPLLEHNEHCALVFTGVIVSLPEADHALYCHPEKTRWCSREYVACTIAQRNCPISPGCTLLRRKDATFDLPATADDELQELATRFGAGPDVHLLIHTAKRYQEVAHVPRFLSFFIGTSENCITINNESDVGKAYDKLFKLLLNEDSLFMNDVEKIVCNIKRKEKFRTYMQTLQQPFRALYRSIYSS